MSGSLLDLARRMEELKVAIPVATNNLKKEVARTIQRDLVKVTPVDESTAISNWVLTADEPWHVELSAYYLGSAGSTERQSAAAALQQGEQQLARSNPGMPVFISNNAAHIRQLNEGSSKQAPAGFVERSVLIGRKVVKRVGLVLKVNGRYVR